MNHQTTLTYFFKPKATSYSIMQDNRKKKLNLSLNKMSPNKTPKLSACAQSPQIVIISDDEDFLSEPTLEVATPNQSPSDASDSTIIYMQESPTAKNNLPLSKRNSSPPKTCSPITTPRKKTFYSPTKKRSIKLRTPNKARKNLSHALSEHNENVDEAFVQICKRLDDKTIFMLEMINNYLKEKSLNHLLAETSNNLLQKSLICVNIGNMLIRNLYWRKHRWFRLDELQDIIKKRFSNLKDSSFHEMLDSLLKNEVLNATNYLGQKNILSFDEYISILNLKQIKEVCKLFKLKATTKEESIKTLKCFIKQRKSNITAYFKGVQSNNETRVLQCLAEKCGACFKLSDQMRNTLDELYMLMYLGVNYQLIREKKLELTLIQDKANIQTFPYDRNDETDNASVVFKTREDFERYRNAVNMYEDYLLESDVNRKCSWVRDVYQLYGDIEQKASASYLVLPVWLRRFTPQHMFIKVIEDGVKYLKKQNVDDSIQLALDITSTLIGQTAVRQHKKAEWYAEKALILDKFKSDPNEAAITLLEGFNSELPEEAKDILRPRATLLANRKTNGISEDMKVALMRYAEKEAILERELNVKHLYKMPKEMSRGGKIKFETRNSEGILVQEAEDYCMSQYIAEGKYTHGGHWEGRIITTIFFLLFWDVIYAKMRAVRGLVLSRFQTYPLDMFGEGFYNNRSALLQERLQHIETSTTDALLESMQRVWDGRPENEISGINRQIGWDNVSMVCSCLGPAALAVVCRRLALNYGRAHSGFPDLTLWNVNTKKIAFVEVKTDSDKPSMKQIQWMHYLKGHGISTEFCYVGVNTTRCRTRGRDESNND